MQDEVGDERLLERRREALDELLRQPADEADRVGDEVAAALVLEAARRRVERLEEPVSHRDLGVRERVQERRLADVRVAGERDGRRLGAPALLAADVALLLEPLEPALQERDAAARDPAVGLELRLAGAPRADAAAEALEVLPHAAHARQVVLELRELDLELALGADGVLGEDVEDQLGPVDDAGLELVLERALLRRVELVVDEQHLGAAPPCTRASAPRACPCRRRCADRGAAGAGRARATGSTPAVRASSRAPRAPRPRRPPARARRGRARARARRRAPDRAATATAGHYDDCRARPRPRSQDAPARRRASESRSRRPRRARARAHARRSRASTTARCCSTATAAVCSPATSTRSPPKGTFRAGSRTDRCTGSARAT